MTEPCAICHRHGAVGNEELRATLCHACDAAFLAWYATHPWCIASDYPAWNRHRRGAMATPAEGAGATNTRPITQDQRAQTDAWHLHRKATA